MNWYYLSSSSAPHRIHGLSSSHQRRRPGQLSSSFSLLDCCRLCWSSLQPPEKRQRSDVRQRYHRLRRLEMARQQQQSELRRHSPLSLETKGRPGSLRGHRRSPAPSMPSITEDEVLTFSPKHRPGSPVSTTSTIL
mmetsp:Transcript_25651/g.83125  ORF Transcript_25651/g.83125 Transcript_25651/m.83125 type:complete len:136 (-) Transcript_25651:373-780(-)